MKKLIRYLYNKLVDEMYLPDKTEWHITDRGIRIYTNGRMFRRKWVNFQEKYLWKK